MVKFICSRPSVCWIFVEVFLAVSYRTDWPPTHYSSPFNTWYFSSLSQTIFFSVNLQLPSGFSSAWLTLAISVSLISVVSLHPRLQITKPNLTFHFNTLKWTVILVAFLVLLLYWVYFFFLFKHYKKIRWLFQYHIICSSLQAYY